MQEGFPYLPFLMIDGTSIGHGVKGRVFTIDHCNLSCVRRRGEQKAGACGFILK